MKLCTNINKVLALLSVHQNNITAFSTGYKQKLPESEDETLYFQLPFFKLTSSNLEQIYS